VLASPDVCAAAIRASDVSEKDPICKTPLLETVALGKDFRLGTREVRILENINLKMKSGELLTLLGKSGCGKSTLLSLLAGMETPSRGEVRVEGISVKGPHPSRSILFQKPTLLPWLTVEENIVFGAKLRGDTEDLKERAEQIIEGVELSGFEKLFPPKLSLGMAHRACLARALLAKPKLLLLDETFASVDFILKESLCKTLMEAWHSDRFTVVLVTHNIEDALVFADRAVILGGKPTTVKGLIDTSSDRCTSDLASLRSEITGSFGNV